MYLFLPTLSRLSHPLRTIDSTSNAEKMLYESVSYKGVHTALPVAALHPSVPLEDIFSLETYFTLF